MNCNIIHEAITFSTNTVPVPVGHTAMSAYRTGTLPHKKSCSPAVLANLALITNTSLLSRTFATKCHTNLWSWHVPHNHTNLLFLM